MKTFQKNMDCLIFGSIADCNIMLLLAGYWFTNQEPEQ